MYHYFYKITNNINGKYYYGVHSTNNLDDGYMGSGKYLHNAYKKHGISNFTKTILKYFNDSDSMYLYESEVVDKNIVKDKNSYNIALGGRTGFRANLLPQDEYNKYCETMSIATLGEKNGFYGKTHTNETRKKLSESASKRTGEKNPFYGKSHNDETRSKISKANSGRHPSEEARNKMSEAQKQRKGEKAAFYGRRHTNESLKKLRDASLNRKWVNDGYMSKFIKENDLDSYIKNGWFLGRVHKNTSDEQDGKRN